MVEVRSDPIVIRQRPKMPNLLVRKAREAGVEPISLIVDAIARTSTIGQAAEELGVTEKTLRLWRRALNIQIVKESA